MRLRGETIRALTAPVLSAVRGGLDEVSRGACGTAATDGATGCLSEATGCESICMWSCVNQSCTVQGDTAA